MNDLFLFANVVDDRINGEHHLGGEGAFAAAAIQVLKETYNSDVSYTLAGKIGKDESGYFLKKTLESLGVDVSGLTVGGTQTCQAIINGVQRAEFVGFEGGPVCSFSKGETSRFSELLKSPGWVFMTSNTIYDEETWEQAFSLLETSPRLLFFDINWREACLKRSGFSFDEFAQKKLIPILKRAHIIKGTHEEFHRFKEVLEEIKPIWRVETRACEGALIHYQGKEFFQKAPKVTEIQDTGAGDTFSGSLLFDLARRSIQTEHDLRSLHGEKLKEMIRLACRVAAMTVQGFGVNYVNENRTKLLDPL